jgi:hypothetical protein
VPQAVEIVKQAIAADQSGEYERALQLYRRSLEYFMTGLKYEQNPAAKQTIMMVRFEAHAYIFYLHTHTYPLTESGRVYEAS